MYSSYLVCLETDSAGRNFYLVEMNGKISFNVSDPLPVEISYSKTGDQKASFQFGNEYLDRNSHNDDAGKTQTQTWFTLVEAGLEGADKVYLIQTTLHTPSGDQLLYLSIPDPGVPGTDPLVFNPLPGGTNPPPPPRNQKWVFKPIPPDDPIRKK